MEKQRQKYVYKKKKEMGVGMQTKMQEKCVNMFLGHKA